MNCAHSVPMHTEPGGWRLAVRRVSPISHHFPPFYSCIMLASQILVATMLAVVAGQKEANAYSPVRLCTEVPPFPPLRLFP